MKVYHTGKYTVYWLVKHCECTVYRSVNVGKCILYCPVNHWLTGVIVLSGWPSGLRRYVQVVVYNCRRGFESHF